MALKNMQENIDKYSQFSLMFMTDGQSCYPDRAVKAIKADAQVMAKMKFKSVAYGCGSPALAQLS